MRAYRTLLRLLPADVRARHGEQMMMVFGDLRTRARAAGAARTAILWMAEAAGMIRFGMRARVRRLLARAPQFSPGGRPSGPRLGHDLYWAWRNVRARGPRAALIVGLLAIALAANTLVFAVADSMLFRKLPFAAPERLAGFIAQNAKPDERASESVSPGLLDQWRAQADVFAGVETYLTKTLFLSGGGAHESVAVADVTPGMMSLLGVRPRWGRDLEPADAGRADVGVVLISEPLARARFGDPAMAVGQTLTATAGPLIVVGVMPENVRFPTQAFRIWRALDPRGPLAANFRGTFAIARLRDGVTLESAAAMVAQRSAAIGQATGRRTPYAVTVAPHALGAIRPGDDRLFWLLLGAALCLLAIACANVTSVEIAGAIARARTSAVQLALGASRGTLARVALLEGAMLFGLAAVSAIGLAYGGMQLMTAKLLPPSLRGSTANPIDLDQRAMVFMALAAAAAWLLTMLPIVLRTYRVDLLGLLKLEDRSSAASAGSARLRRALTLVEVALAILLATSALLWARSYGTLLGADKGFESRNIASISYTLPPQFYATIQEKRALERVLLDKLGAMPGVTDVAAGSPPTGGLEMHGDVRVLVDDRPADAQGVILGLRYVDSKYFSVLGIPLLRGRMFSETEPPTNTIVSAAFARRYWGDEDPVGRTFRQSDRQQVMTVIGVAGDLRLRPPDMQGVAPASLDVYFARQPPPPPRPTPPGARVGSGGSFGFVTVMARFDTPERVKQARQIATAIEPRFAVDVELVDDEYAEQFSQVLLVTRVVGAFGVLALLVAMLGLYAVLALLVTARHREIGIRMALGAGRADIRRLVVSSSFRLVLAGAVLGGAAAIVIARASASMLYGVKPADPVALGAVTAIVVVTALLATWRPAVQATAIDPSTLLRS